MNASSKKDFWENIHNHYKLSELSNSNNVFKKQNKKKDIKNID